MKHKFLKRLAALAVFLIGPVACSTGPEIDYQPRLENVAETSENFMRQFENMRRSPEFSAETGVEHLKAHILMLQQEIRAGAVTERRLAEEAANYKHRYEEALPSAQKWDSLTMSATVLAVGAAVLVVLLVAGWLYSKFSPAGAAAGGIVSLIRSIFS